jgi:hypothetical protein
VLSRQRMAQGTRGVAGLQVIEPEAGRDLPPGKDDRVDVRRFMTAVRRPQFVYDLLTAGGIV